MHDAMLLGMSQNRRTFLATLGSAAVAAACSRGPFATQAATPVGRRKLSRIGIQLYTLRTVAQKDLAGTLASLGKIGYTDVEFAGYYNHPPAEVRDMLKTNGLKAPSVHVGIDVIEKTPDKLFEESR